MPVIARLSQSTVSAGGTQYENYLHGAAFAALLSAPLCLWALFFTADYEYATALVFVPIIFVFSLVLIYWVCLDNRFLMRTVAVALLLKIACTGAYIFMGYRIYDQSIDCVAYFQQGVHFANLFWGGYLDTIQPPFFGTRGVELLAGLFAVGTGNSFPSICVIFALLSLAGQYFYYRAYEAAFPEGDKNLAAVLIFLIPSVLFWPATIGKDALVTFGTGVTSYALANWVFKGRATSLMYLAAGLGAVLLARPHIAAMLVLALFASYVLQPQRRGFAGTLGKIVAVPLLALATLYFASQAQQFLSVDSFDTGISKLQRTSQDSSVGGSAYNATTVSRAVTAPFVVARPFPWEVHNLQSALASVEGTLISLFLWRRRRLIVRRITKLRTPFVLFILIFNAQLTVMFAFGVSNFGILVRERVMMLPLALMLACDYVRPKPYFVGSLAYRNSLSTQAP